MKNLKILLRSVTLIIITVITIQSCTSDNSKTPEINKINLEVEKSTQISQESQFENLSSITKEEYLSMSPKRKIDFYEAYIDAFRSGGGCYCESSSGGCRCSTSCPTGTKPKCQCSSGGCDCGCEPYGSGGIAMRYIIKVNKDGSVILTEKEFSKKSINNFANSNLPNAAKIAELFVKEPIFNRKNSENIKLTVKEYYVLESKFQAYMENYTIEQYFEIEYGI